VKYTVIVILDTEILPSSLKSELVSWLEFEPRYSTTVHSVVVLMDGEEVAVYDREEEENSGNQDHSE
jgi:hypothetical protein